MVRLPFRAGNSRKTLILLVFIGSLLALASGGYVAARGLSYRELLVGGGLVAILALLMTGERALHVGFMFWIATLALGYRTIEVTPYLRIHPGELLLWGLLFLLVASYRWQAKKLKAWLPGWIWLLFPFWLWAWIPGLYAGYDWSRMLAEFRNFLLLIPLLVVAQHYISTRTQWRWTLTAFYAVGIWIALLGAVEYLFPAIAGLAPGFVSDPLATEELGGFNRARFSFWGSPVASFILILTIPLAGALWRCYESPFTRVALILSLLLQVYGVYIGGYRSMWLTLAIVIVLWAVLRYGLLSGIVLLAPLGALVNLLPQTTLFRGLTLILALQGDPSDSSSITRSTRLLNGLEIVRENPEGIGWSGAGWTHSDFLQVAANQGLLAGLLFLGAYFWTLGRLLQSYRLSEKNTMPAAITLSLLLAFVASGSLLAFQGVQVLPQLILPVWLVWVLAEIWLRQAPIEEG